MVGFGDVFVVGVDDLYLEEVAGVRRKDGQRRRMGGCKGGIKNTEPEGVDSVAKIHLAGAGTVGDPDNGGGGLGDVDDFYP